MTNCGADELGHSGIAQKPREISKDITVFRESWERATLVCWCDGRDDTGSVILLPPKDSYRYSIHALPDWGQYGEVPTQ